MDVFDFITNRVAAAADTANDAIELTELEAVGLPAFVAIFIQTERKALGFSAITNPTYLGIFGILAVILFSLFTSALYSLLMKIISIYTDVFTGKKVPIWKLLVFCLTFGFFLSYIIYYIFVKPYLDSQKIDVAGDIAKELNSLNIEYFANQISDTSLLNLQTLAIKQAAYVGPSEIDGNFEASTGIQSALQTGTRVFVFQIGYLEAKKDSTKFDSPYTPTLLYRDDTGKLISSNGANIGEVAKNLAAYAFSPSIQSASQPLIIYLHFERTPNALREPEKYVKFLSTVAQLLEPLQEFLVGPTPEGNFKRQQNENVLLSTPVSTFEKKIILFSNADTTIFRNLKGLGLDTVDPKYDLDFLVNVRVYLDDKNDSIGISTVPLNGQTPNAVIVPFDRLIAMSDDEMDTFALKGKSRFVIAMPSQMKNPAAESISKVLDVCNVNCIPLNLFGESIDSLKKKVKIWKGEPFFKTKSPNYRAVPLP